MVPGFPSRDRPTPGASDVADATPEVDVEGAFARTRVLVVEPVRTARLLLRGQLQQLGFVEIVEAGGASEALRRLADSAFGLVICEETLATGGNDATTGQQLLEHVRETALIAPSTIFVLCTAESARDRVAAALECPPDDYLLKPFTAERLAARLQRVFEKRLVMDPAMRRIALKDFAQAAIECERIAAAHPRWRLEALRLRGRALLDLGRADEADRAFAQALDEREDLAWARVGRARAALLAGRLDDAQAFASAALRSADARPGAFDVLAGVARARGDEAALSAVLQHASRAVPSVRRRREFAHAAYRAGDLATARAEFDRIVRSTRDTVAAVPADVAHLGQIHVDTGDAVRAITLLTEDRAPRNGAHTTPAAVLARQSVLAQAHAARSAFDAAVRALQLAREAADRLAESSGDGAAAGAPGVAAAARLHLARAFLSLDDRPGAMAALGEAIRADHENPALADLARRMLSGTGLEQDVERVIGESTRGMTEAIERADALMRAAQYDESIATLNSALATVPDNTALLIAATRLHLLWLRQKGLERAYVERVREFLQRLERLAPDSPQVLRLHRFFRETLNRGQGD